ncbi:G/T mismatch-specific thymine DNA glycosylase [Holothuria leucospilota]|uniref:G/T mismatch-specific thymine DNA glycosylase n=1 Tax=Holothuria leucospilota TaxID=206669 RepID=A0A9Q1HFI4_HOLLE|nr:G/T mismatch-specific thymine DNA glycosylase [Holothuria leucospilota]
MQGNMDMYQQYQYNGYPPLPPVKQEPMDYPPPYPMEYMDMNNYQPLPPVPPPLEEPQPKVKKRKTKQDKVTDHFKEKKPRKKIDRFKGMPEEEVAKRTLPDHLKEGLDIVIIGINPGLMAAFKGHHYAGPGNHFWKCLYLSGMTSEPMTAMDDFKLLDIGIGFTNMVERTTRGSADLTRKEIKEGAQIMIEKIRKYKPLIACFNGKGIYEIFSGKKDFEVGRQPETIPGTDTVIYVMPSSSARCSQFPRAQDKVQFYVTLRNLRDELKGLKTNNGIPKALPCGSPNQSEASETNSTQTSVPAKNDQPVKIKEEKTDGDESYKTCQSTKQDVPCSSQQSVPVKSEPLESKDYITLQPMNPLDSSFIHNSMSSYADNFTVKQEPLDNPFTCPGNGFLPTIKQEISPSSFSGPNSQQEWPTMDLGNFIDDIPPIASNAAVPVTEEEYSVQEGRASQPQFSDGNISASY